MIAEDEDKPSVYEKTKRRYLDIEDSLKTSLGYVQAIKKQYNMDVSNFEMAYQDDPIHTEVLGNIEDRLKRLESIAALSEVNVSKIEQLDRIDVSTEHKLDQHILDLPVESVVTNLDNTLPSDTPSYMKSPKYEEHGGYENMYDATVNIFDEVLRDVSEISSDEISSYHPDIPSGFNYYHVTACAKLIYTWFHARFVTYQNSSKFDTNRYIFTIPRVIEGILFGYCDWLNRNDTLFFCNDVMNWCDSLADINSENSSWGCPPLVTCYYKKYDPKLTFSLEAVCIYETLLRIGYSKLTRDSLIASEELQSYSVDQPLVSLDVDLVVHPRAFRYQKDWVKSILINRTSSEGYLDLLTSCPEFMIRESF